MRSFFWKFVICLTPCLLAGWVTSRAVSGYLAGESGGFKLGVDLVGGTILVYEIDLKKKQTDGKEKGNEAGRDTNLLAESLKRRIDPNDLYNIVIRPAGGEGRVEIILPTGGIHRTQKAENAWNQVLDQVAEEFKLKKVEVGRGKIQELADRIQTQTSETIWTKLFQDPKVWNNLLQQTEKEWRELPRGTWKKFESLPVGNLPVFLDALKKELAINDTTNVTEASLKNWIKREAWQATLNKAMEKWPDLQSQKDELERIQPDNNEQLLGFIQTKGSIYGEAVLNAIEPFVGPDILDGGPFPETKTIKDFIADNYGPSIFDIMAKINKVYTGQSKDLTVEEVQRIKELVSKVGSLEFGILANAEDDKKAEADAIKYFEDPANKDELEKLQKDGLPPPGPRVANSKTLEKYDLNLPRGNKSLVTYRWVELGPQERRQLNLDNAAATDPARSVVWNQMQLARNKGIATTLKDPYSTSGRLMLQGALFYSRECINRNLPDEERRNKKYEYFVLVRNPEIDPADPLKERETPRIDGSYLISAVNSPGADLRPAVHFTFNAAGGDLFGTVTRKNVPSGAGGEDAQVKRHLAIILDGLVMSAPTINSEIRTQGQISGSFTQKEVDNLVNILRSGALPATLKPQPVSESTMGPTLGQDTIRAGITAIGSAFLAVVAFMIFYYWFAGFVASIALFANLLLTIGFMVSVQATFTLPGLAGLVLTLGMAVDANVLIYERLREERERGASLLLALRNGYDRALPTIIDTHLSSIFTAIVLYVVGNDQLKGFGVSLTVGLLISLFTSLYMTRVIFDFWAHMGWLKNLRMLKFFSKPNIDFMSIRKQMFTATLVLAILGLVLFIARIDTILNIDFVGGTAYGGQLTEAKTINELRALLDPKQQEKLLKVKAEEEEGSEGRRFKLTYTDPNGSKDVRTVTFANIPAGSTPAERSAVVEKNARQLPDMSVEQIYPSFDKRVTATKSPHFIVRTSEKESELVQASIDRLLRVEANGQTTPLLQKLYMWIDPADKDKAAIRIRFYASEPPAKFDPVANEQKPEDQQVRPEWASPSFVKTLLVRELGYQFEKGKLPEFELQGEGTTREGRFQAMTVVIKGDSLTTMSKEDVAKFSTALAETQREFAARPQPDRLENFDSQLATETRFRAMWAIVASWVAILLYLWFRFGSWIFGLAAVVCLVHDLFLTMGAIAVCRFFDGTFLGHALMLEDFKIDLPAVAAFLTLVGYSVNDTIVVFDRIREVRGKNPDLTPQMINDSINQTLSRTILASFTTWLVVIVLYIWGGPGVHLFAFVMVIGVLIGTYSSIYIASPLLLMLGEGQHDDTPRSGAKPQVEGATV